MLRQGQVGRMGSGVPHICLASGEAKMFAIDTQTLETATAEPLTFADLAHVVVNLRARLAAVEGKLTRRRPAKLPERPGTLRTRRDRVRLRLALPLGGRFGETHSGRAGTRNHLVDCRASPNPDDGRATDCPDARSTARPAPRREALARCTFARRVDSKSPRR